MADEIKFDMSEIKSAEAMLRRMGGAPPKVANKAASKAATVVRKATRNAAPVRTGTLKRAIRRNGERSRVRGKKVYDLYFDPAYNDRLQKPIRNPGQYGGKKNTAYYPASMEYGFLTRAGGGIRFEGLHFMRGAADDSEAQARAAATQAALTEINKIWNEKKGG